MVFACLANFFAPFASRDLPSTRVWIHNTDSTDSNIAFDSSNRISNHHPILGTSGIRPLAASIVQIDARMSTPASRT